MGEELVIARFAFVPRGPMPKRVHVLNSSLSAAKFAIACLALIVIIHAGLVLEPWCGKEVKQEQ